ncbi:MAG: tetratricopeptide repeat protein [bacterium]
MTEAHPENHPPRPFESPEAPAKPPGLLAILFDRANFTAYLGAVCLLTSAFLLWYEIPGALTEPSRFSLFRNAYPQSQIFFRAGVVLIGLATLVLLILRRRPHLCLVGILALFVGLLFPHYLMTWEPAAAMQIILRVQQERNLDFEVHDTHLNKEIPWSPGAKTGTIVNRLVTFKLVVSNKDFFQIANAPAWVDGLGLSDDFFQFIKLGWVLCLVGGLSFITSHFLQEPSRRRPVTRRQILIGMGVGIAVMAALLTPLAVGNYYLYLARDHDAQGFDGKSLAASLKARQWIPALDYNTEFHKTLGGIYYRSGFTEEADYCNYMGDLYLHNNSLLRAEYWFRKALEKKPNFAVARYNLAVTLYDRAAQDFNDGGYASARDIFEEVLRVDPVHLQAMYNLTTCYLKLESYDSARSMLKQIIQLQKYYQLPAIVLTSQCYLRLGWCEFQEGRPSEALALLRKGVDLSQWD